MRWTVGVLAWVCMVTVVVFAGCKQSEPEVTGGPQLLTRQAVSVVDGMILLDYPGPKGQILKKNGSTDYFCDLPEFINAIQDAERTHGHARAYVQAFDGREWGSYPDGWVEASRPVYVIGSDRMGAMGPTLVPFLDMDAAKAFTAKHGGRIVRLAELTPEVMAEHGRMARDMLRKGHMMDHMRGQKPSGHGPHASGHGHNPHGHDNHPTGHGHRQ